MEQIGDYEKFKKENKKFTRKNMVFLVPFA